MRADIHEAFEQMAWLGFGVCDRGYILESGVIVLEGTRAELMSHLRVLEAYLGKSRTARDGEDHR